MMGIGGGLVGGAWLMLLASAVAAEPCESASPGEAKAMAVRATALIEEVGPRQAFRTFMDPDGGFIDRDLYVFVLDLDGVLWVNGAFPDAVGSQALDAQTADGRYFVREMIALATTGGEGWVEYEFTNPCTGEFTEKVSFVKRAGRFIVGVGAYGTVTA
jgi:signal transduction histidine kinase